MSEHGPAPLTHWETKQRCLCDEQFATRRELAEHIRATWTTLDVLVDDIRRAKYPPGDDETSVYDVLSLMERLALELQNHRHGYRWEVAE